MHKYRRYDPKKLNLWSFFHLIFKCDLDLQPKLENFSNGTITPQGEHLCKISLKSMQNVGVMVRTRIYVTFKFDLQPTLMFQIPPQGQQLCQIILKPMHKCRIYGPDKSGRTHAHTHKENSNRYVSLYRKQAQKKSKGQRKVIV